MRAEPVGHEEVEVAEGAADARVGGDEGLVAGAELGHLGLVPDARAAVGVDVLRVDLRVQELDDALALGLVDAEVAVHAEGLGHQGQRRPDLDGAHEREVAGEVGAREAKQCNEELDLPAVVGPTLPSGRTEEGGLEALVQGVDVDELGVVVLAAPALENSDGVVDVHGLEPHGYGDVVAVGGLDEHGGLEPLHPVRELEVGLPNCRRRLGSGRDDEPLGVVVVGVDGLPINHQPAPLARPHHVRDAVADELDDLVLEVWVHDGLHPRGDVVGQNVLLPEVDELHARPALELRDGLGARHEALVVEGQDHGLAAVLVEVAVDDAGELRVDEVRPRLDALRLHELDLPVDEGGL